MYVRGWMLSEASLAGGQVFSSEDRLSMIGEARRSFTDSMAVSADLKPNLFTDSRYRKALAIAHLPLIEAIINGNVKPETQELVVRDSLMISRTISNATRPTGLVHEINTLSLINMMKDPRYIAMPSTYRGDSGIYNRSQTHDISLIKQHYGKIRQIQPIEVKSHVSDDHRDLYWPTLISSDTIASVARGDPLVLSGYMLDVLNGKSSEECMLLVQVATNSLTNLLKVYRRTGRPPKSIMQTPTRFYGRNQYSVA